MTFITSEAPICTGVSPPVNRPAHTPTHMVIISSDSAHIQLGPTVLVHVTDHKQNTHSSTGDTPQDIERGSQRNIKRQGCRAYALLVCMMPMMGACVCIYVFEASREREQMPAGHVISLTLGHRQR